MPERLLWQGMEDASCQLSRNEALNSIAFMELNPPNSHVSELESRYFPAEPLNGNPALANTWTAGL